MENSKKEKAIVQAIASLQIDRIYVNPNYVSAYRAKNSIPVPSVHSLTLKRGVNSGRKPRV